MVKVLRPILTPQNHESVLAEAKHRSRKECELIVARLQPKPDVPSTIRKLPTPAARARALRVRAYRDDDARRRSPRGRVAASPAAPDPVPSAR